MNWKNRVHPLFGCLVGVVWVVSPILMLWGYVYLALVILLTTMVAFSVLQHDSWRARGRSFLIQLIVGPLVALFGLVLTFAIISLYPSMDQEQRVAIEQVPEVESATTQAEQRDAVLARLDAYPYSPAWWMNNPHAQSFYGPFFRNPNYDGYRAERLTTPDDDFIMLQYADGEAEKPLVVLFHGLEGSAQSFYAKALKTVFNGVGWNFVTMEFRFCSGEINNTLRIYHMGETTDIDHVVKTLAAREPERPLYLIGVSLGANVLCKWLGEQGDAVPDQVKAAAAIAPPFMPHKSVPAFHDALGGFYVWHFLRSLKPKARAKEAQFPGSIDMVALEACKDFYEYDTIVTARLHGFDDAMDYWEKVGCHQFLPGIRIPTLLIAAKDDPFNPEDTIPYEAVAGNPWLHPQWTEQGGHVGFVSGPTPWQAYSWAEEQAMRFFQCYVAEKSHRRPSS